MEIKDTLKKPFTETQRDDFVVNYQYDYEIKETDKELQAWGYTEDEEREREAERISHLKCTKRVLALILEELGVPYSRLKSLIDSNERAQLEWDLCVELERCNPLLDLFGAQLGFSPEQIDQIFKYANGEADSLEVE